MDGYEESENERVIADVDLFCFKKERSTKKEETNCKCRRFRERVSSAAAMTWTKSATTAARKPESLRCCYTSSSIADGLIHREDVLVVAV